MYGGNSHSSIQSLRKLKTYDKNYNDFFYSNFSYSYFSF